MKREDKTELILVILWVAIFSLIVWARMSYDRELIEQALGL